MGLVGYRPKRKRQPPESVEPSERWINRGLVLAINGRSGGRVVAWTSNGLTVNTMLGAVALGAREPGLGGLYTGTQGTSIKGSASASAVNGSEFITLVTTAAPSTLANEIRALGFANDGGTALFNLEVASGGVWRLQIRNNASVALNLAGASAAVGRADTIIGRVSGYGGEAAIFTPSGKATGTCPAGPIGIINSISVGFLDRNSGNIIEQGWEGWLGDQFVFDKALTDEECFEIRDNPACIWDKRRILVPASAPSGTSYTFSASGSVAFSGTSPFTVTLVSAYTFSASGSVAFSGAAPMIRTWFFTPSGVVAFSGTAPFTVTGATSYTFSASGSVAFSGAAALTRGYFFLPSGVVAFSGTSPFSTGGSTSYTFSASGSVAFSGASLLSRGRVMLPSGGVTFSGSALWQKGWVFPTSGSVNFSGTANMYWTSGLASNTVDRLLKGYGV